MKREREVAADGERREKITPAALWSQQTFLTRPPPHAAPLPLRRTRLPARPSTQGGLKEWTERLGRVVTYVAKASGCGQRGSLSR